MKAILPSSFPMAYAFLLVVAGPGRGAGAGAAGVTGVHQRADLRLTAGATSIRGFTSVGDVILSILMTGGDISELCEAGHGAAVPVAAPPAAPARGGTVSPPRSARVRRRRVMG